VNIASAPIQFFTPVFSREVLHAGVTGYGYLEAAAAVGGIIAALISGRVAHKYQLWQWMVISFVTSGIAFILIAAFPSLVLSVILFGVSMAANALFNIPFASTLQLLAPSEMRGGVMSSFGLFFGASVPIGLIGGGWITNLLGPRFVFSCVGAIIGFAGLFGMTTKALRADLELERAMRAGEPSSMAMQKGV
jgi:MFS family permease